MNWRKMQTGIYKIRMAEKYPAGFYITLASSECQEKKVGGEGLEPPALSV